MITATNANTAENETMGLTAAMASIAPTKAALELEKQVASVSPHKLIELMLEGAIERVDQAKQTLSVGEHEEAGLLIDKAIGIVGGLKDSLDFKEGGEIASRLDTLYSYITNRLCAADVNTGESILNEVGQLLGEVRSGWGEMKLVPVA